MEEIASDILHLEKFISGVENIGNQQFDNPLSRYSIGVMKANGCKFPLYTGNEGFVTNIAFSGLGVMAVIVVTIYAIIQKLLKRVKDFFHHFKFSMVSAFRSKPSTEQSKAKDANIEEEADKTFNIYSHHILNAKKKLENADIGELASLASSLAGSVSKSTVTHMLNEMVKFTDKKEPKGKSIIKSFVEQYTKTESDWESVEDKLTTELDISRTIIEQIKKLTDEKKVDERHKLLLDIMTEKIKSSVSFFTLLIYAKGYKG